MTWRQKTGVVLAISTAALIVWDLVVVAVAGSGATISDVLLTIAYRNPVVPLFLGGLMSHLFWTGKTLGPATVRCFIGAAILTAAGILGPLGHLWMPPACPLFVGVFLGRLLVPQSSEVPDARHREPF